MNNLYFYLFITVLLHLIGMVIFGHFEAQTSIIKRLSKVGLIIIGTAIAYQVVGGIGAVIFSFGLLGFGLIIHFMWCHHHEIHPITAEPKERYYQLRGWS